MSASWWMRGDLKSVRLCFVNCNIADAICKPLLASARKGCASDDQICRRFFAVRVIAIVARSELVAVCSTTSAHALLPQHYCGSQCIGRVRLTWKCGERCQSRCATWHALGHRCPGVAGWKSEFPAPCSWGTFHPVAWWWGYLDNCWTSWRSVSFANWK